MLANQPISQLSDKEVTIVRRRKVGFIFQFYNLMPTLTAVENVAGIEIENSFDADVHGFRTSFRTWAQERTNFPREVAEAALAHTIKDKAEAAYARSDVFDKRRKMMEAWAAYLAQEAGTVVRIGA